MSGRKSSPRFQFTVSALFLCALLFLVPALQEGNPTLFLLAALVPCAMLLSDTLFARMFSLDRMLLSVALLLCASGIAALSFAGPDAGLAQALRCGAALFALLFGGILIRSLAPSLLTSLCTAFLGLLFLASGIFASTFGLPLAEIALALLLVSFTSLLVRQGPLAAILCAFAALVLLLVRREAVEALIWGLTVLLLLFAVDGRPVVLLPSLAAMLALFFLSSRFFPSPSFVYESSLLPGLVSAGAVGSDVLPEALSASGTDALFPLLAGRLGLVFSGLVVLLFLPFTLRAASVASAARSRFHAGLAMGASLLLALRALLSLLVLFGILPLPDAVIPFLTGSLSSLCAQMFLVGLLCGISGRNDADLAEDAHLAMLAK